MPSGVLGRFHEISLSTKDIRASVEFYEQLGFTQAPTNDTWTHPYGVLTDGRIFIGLHQREFPSPAITFVHADIAQHIVNFESRGLKLAFRRTGEDVFNEIGLKDPGGQLLTVLEARTYSPVDRTEDETSLCGYFQEISVPTSDFEATKQFWEPLGFVATEESDQPYVHLPLTSDHLDVAFHRPRTLDRPALVFGEPDMATRIKRIRSLGVRLCDELPRGLDGASNALLEAPEGTLLLLLTQNA